MMSIGIVKPPNCVLAQPMSHGPTTPACQSSSRLTSAVIPCEPLSNVIDCVGLSAAWWQAHHRSWRRSSPQPSRWTALHHADRWLDTCALMEHGARPTSQRYMMLMIQHQHALEQISGSQQQVGQQTLATDSPPFQRV